MPKSPNLQLALGCGIRDQFDEGALRYERIIIMTDADVDDPYRHLADDLLLPRMPELVRRANLFLAQPPLYRITAAPKSLYASATTPTAAEIEAKEFQGQEGRRLAFKGLGK